MQALLPDEAKSFVEAKGRLVVEFGLQNDLHTRQVPPGWDVNGWRTSSAPSAIIRSIAI